MCDVILIRPLIAQLLYDCTTIVYTVSQKKSSPQKLSNIFPKWLGIFSPNFTCLLNVPIYAGLQIFIQLSATLM